MFAVKAVHLDHFATIDRERQQELTRKAIVEALEAVARGNAPANSAPPPPTGSAGG